MKRKLSLALVMLFLLTLAGLAGVTESRTYAATPRTGAWSKASSMSADRYNHTATLLHNGQVLVTGGFSNSDTTAKAELYTIKTGKWAKARPMSIGRVYHTATLLPNGKVLVVGGWVNGKNDSGNALATAELYTIKTGKWAKTGLMSTARLGHTATLLPDGKVLVAGGTMDRQGDGDGLATAELYDPKTGTWSSTGSMSTSRVDYTATLLSNGKVLVAGGWDNNGNGNGNALDTAELYDPKTGTWSSTGSMSTDRVHHTATLLSNGQVLVTGGDSEGTAELYDPDSGTWSQISSMSMARLGHTATLLPNGKVLVAGGWTEDSIAKAELFSL